MAGLPMPEGRYADGSYLRANPCWHAEDAQWKVSHILDMIDAHALAPDSVCEVGCGAGSVIDGVAHGLQSASEFTGVDVSPDALALCARLHNSRVSFRLQDALEGGFGPFDLLLAIDVIEHVPDYLGFLSALRVKADYKIFHIPLDLSAQAALRPTSFTAVRNSIGHLHYFTKEIALAALAETGYDVLDVRFTSGAVELGAPSWKRRSAQLPRRAVSALSVEFAARMFGGFSILVLAR